MTLERRLLSGGVAAEVPRSVADAGVDVAFLERTGGISTGAFATLNLGLRAGDEPHAAVENRRRAATALGLAAWACVRQVHGATLVRARALDAGAGFADPASALGAADAIVTDAPGVAIAILTADCVPVVLADPAGGTLAVVHAGWKGIVAGVIGEASRAFAAEPLAAIGPAVGPDHYEVGEDVADAIDAAVDGGAVAERDGPRPRIDLAATVERILRSLGVTQIERSASCTACEPERFFSHRRDGVTGRQAAVAVRR